MNLRNNKGYTGIDISVAMIIILIFIPTIFGIVYNLQRTRARTEREVVAVGVATDIIEIAKNLDYLDVVISNEDSEFKSALSNKYTNLQISNDQENTLNCSYSDNNDVHYRIQVSVTNYYPSEINESDKKNYVKQISATVTYPVGNSTSSIDISTVLQNNL